MTTMKFNGVESTAITGLESILQIGRDILPDGEDALTHIPFRPGAYDHGRTDKERLIPVRFYIKGNTREQKREYSRNVASWLHSDKVKELIFSDEPEKAYYARPTGPISEEEISTMGFADVTFLCPDPQAQSTTEYTHDFDEYGALVMRIPSWIFLLR